MPLPKSRRIDLLDRLLQSMDYTDRGISTAYLTRRTVANPGLIPTHFEPFCPAPNAKIKTIARQGHRREEKSTCSITEQVDYAEQDSFRQENRDCLRILRFPGPGAYGCNSR
jgi:hypothetical protein